MSIQQSRSLFLPLFLMETAFKDVAASAMIVTIPNLKIQYDDSLQALCTDFSSRLLSPVLFSLLRFSIKKQNKAGAISGSTLQRPQFSVGKHCPELEGASSFALNHAPSGLENG